MLNNFQKTKKDLREVDNITPRRADNIAQILELAKQNPDSIIIMLDAKKDDIVAVHQTHYSVVNIRTRVLGLKKHVCRDLLKNKDFEGNMGKINQVLDGFLFNLIKEINEPKVAENINQDKKHGNKNISI